VVPPVLHDTVKQQYDYRAGNRQARELHETPVVDEVMEAIARREEQVDQNMYQAQQQTGPEKYIQELGNTHGKSP
jgi:hypothetical protein